MGFFSLLDAFAGLQTKHLTIRLLIWIAVEHTSLQMDCSMAGTKLQHRVRSLEQEDEALTLEILL